MKRKWLVVAGVAFLLSVLATAAFAAHPVKLFVNGREVATDVPPQMINGRTMVPVRWLATALGAEVWWDGPNNTVHINKPHFVASLPEAEAKLYPFQEINGMYDGFILEVKGNRQYFDWKNVSNPTFAPRLLHADLNRDGAKELIIILTTGTGTGTHTEDIHVLNPGNLTETEVEDPVALALQKVSSKIEIDGDKVTIHINAGGEATTFTQEKNDAAVWFEQVVLKNVLHYVVIDQALTVSLPAQVSPAGFTGAIEATYVFAGGQYRIKTMRYKNEAEDERAAVIKLVEDFGQRLQTFSLQAPPDIVSRSLQENYGDFVAPALLAKWQSEPQHAPGRLLSSPWPDRIEILGVEQSASGYEIKGEIIEVTSVEAANGGVAARRPVTLTVEKSADRWLITAVQLGAYAETNNATVYQNSRYGFRFWLPESWQGYAIITDKWEGFPPGSAAAVASGPLLTIRHPQWTAQNQRQDIPVMIFTTAQWDALQNREFHTGAAPVGPSELGRNSNYVFALPARYNFAFPAGYEEVERIINSNPLQPLETGTQVVQVYFINTEGAPGELYPVSRTAPTQVDPVEAALQELLGGPTQAEYLQGYRSRFSEQTAGMLRGITRSDSGDTLTIDFADFRHLLGEHNVPATSFAPGGIMADITWTVFKQFPDVQALRFAFHGDEGAFWSWLAGAPGAPEVFTRTDWSQI